MGQDDASGNISLSQQRLKHADSLIFIPPFYELKYAQEKSF